MQEFTYNAVAIRQTEDSPWLVMFGAPAPEIYGWSGIPRKQQGTGPETTGFQREDDRGRVRQIKDFFSNHRNVLQNPLLCAAREGPGGKVTFVPDENTPGEATAVVRGRAVITTEPLEERSLVEILRLLKEHLEGQITTLRGQEVPNELVQRIAESVAEAGEAVPRGDEPSGNDEMDGEAEDVAEAGSVADAGESSEPQAALTEESHVVDFWAEIAARIQVLEELSDADTLEELAGFSRDAMIAYLRPVVLVDGQHRLLGALALAEQVANSEEYAAEIEARIDAGGDPDDVQEEVEARVARILPVSLLMETDPAEHVFQFVIVNQKAVTMGRALLGTIVSTTLSTEEVERVQDRLDRAKIPIRESRILASLVRDAASPFYGRVERGIDVGNRNELLHWNVLSSLMSMFRDLKGGRLYHEKTDYAADWRNSYLGVSPIMDGWEATGKESPIAYWSDPAGPWRDVFIRFWTKVRDEFGDIQDESAHNYWGKPRHSNLFNKVSLTILAADFFRFLMERRNVIESAEHVDELVNTWLEGMSRNYFNRPWDLTGVKRESVGIRAKWSRLWSEYRVSPRKLPTPDTYRIPAKV